MTGDRRPPLILDDPFVTLDDERATRALELLRAIASDFQVIYLTTSDRYDEVADAVVELPGPTMVDDAPPRSPRRSCPTRRLRRRRRRPVRRGPSTSLPLTVSTRRSRRCCSR